MERQVFMQGKITSVSVLPSSLHLFLHINAHSIVAFTSLLMGPLQELCAPGYHTAGPFPHSSCIKYTCCLPLSRPIFSHCSKLLQ